MKERPILFSAPMVRALLAGTKTQTRRAMKPQPWARPEPEDGLWRLYAGDEGMEPFPCPYGQPGDRLWVKESFWGCDLPGYGDTPCVVYDDEWTGGEYAPAEPRPWARKFGRIPSIHMPRDASRITLEVTEVRVERLQDISRNDAAAEGVDEWAAGALSPQGQLEDPRVQFDMLWESINGRGSWGANPWVWVVCFRRLTP